MAFFSTAACERAGTNRTRTSCARSRSGLVDRTAYAEVPPRVEYSLTGLGASLLSAIEPLAAWSAAQRTEIRRHQDAYDTSAHGVRDRAVERTPAAVPPTPGPELPVPSGVTSTWVLRAARR
ncbi:winged helix-turn-helix transcriptional regulator [Streptomyces mirabilis]|uniref:winged helix-turn-helix transcriptional regulator n=1 Tax=Streptomyces mirabilis TaxID=68239 RepID=UPI0036CE6088